jgi:hypothetical protein
MVGFCHWRRRFVASRRLGCVKSVWRRKWG